MLGRGKIAVEPLLTKLFLYARIFLQFEKVIKYGNCSDIEELDLVVDTQASGLVRITKPLLMSLAL